MIWKDSPYRHTIGSGYFPEDLYEEMLKRLPHDKEYEVYPSYPRRSIYHIAGGFWRGVADMITQGKRSRAQLARDLPGYEIKVHTDSPKDMLTYIFYLTPEDRESGGTSIFKSHIRCGGGKMYDPSKFELVKTAPYVRNGYYGHYRSDNSFHGVSPCDFTRNTLQVTFY